MAKTVTTLSGRVLTLPPQKRVRYDDYGPLARDDSRLVDVPSSGKQQRLHWAAAYKLQQMSRAIQAAGLPPLLVASGWRPPGWPTEAAYNAAMIAQYGSVGEGRKWRAFESPHQTGLTVDFGSGGLEPRRRTKKKQQDTATYAWLTENAHRFGYAPLHHEEWHWEIKTPMNIFESQSGSSWGSTWSLLAAAAAVGLVAALLAGRRP